MPFSVVLTQQESLQIVYVMHQKLGLVCCCAPEVEMGCSWPLYTFEFFPLLCRVPRRKERWPLGGPNLNILVAQSNETALSIKYEVSDNLPTTSNSDNGTQMAEGEAVQNMHVHKSHMLAPDNRLSEECCSAAIVRSGERL